MSCTWENEERYADQISATYDGLTNDGEILYDDPNDTYDGKSITVWENELITVCVDEQTPIVSVYGDSIYGDNIYGE